MTEPVTTPTTDRGGEARAYALATHLRRDVGNVMTARVILSVIATKSEAEARGITMLRLLDENEGFAITEMLLLDVDDALRTPGHS